ncbi:MAG TPA: TonB family protein [Candidatus Acidoferrales bacterium]|nr:TonB family protein [Candidatus Acidoferrales bacterium]
MRTQRNVSDSVPKFTDRRIHARTPVRSVAYIDLGQENGGLILNLSEGGVAIHAAEIVAGATFAKMRFQLPNSDRWIETGGKLVWHGQSKKKAGIEFVNLSDEAREQIRSWTDGADVPSEGRANGIPPKAGRRREAPASVARPESLNSGSEFDLAFPSENPGEAEVRTARAPEPRVASPVGLGATSTAPRESRERQAAPAPAWEYDDARSSKNVPGRAFGDSILGNPMFDPAPRPDPFADLGYGAAESDGWVRRNWFAAVLIALVIFGVGGTLAMGPSNVKALARKWFVLIKAPPQANVEANPPAQSTQSDQSTLPTPASAANTEPAPPPSPAASGASPESPAENGAEAFDQGPATPDEKPSPPAAARVPVQGAPPQVRPESSSDDAESAEEITRRFQLEHRDTFAGATNAPVAEINPAPSSRDAAAPVRRRVAPSTHDAAIQHSPQAASTTPASTPTGLVAVSSHFQSVQGIAPDEVADDGRPAAGRLVSIKQPVYPAEAARQGIEGTVRLRVVVDEIGRVDNVYVVSGPPQLVPAAISAVREWRYTGTILDSRAVKSVEDVAMVFRMANSLESPRE